MPCCSLLLLFAPMTSLPRFLPLHSNLEIAIRWLDAKSIPGRVGFRWARTGLAVKGLPAEDFNIEGREQHGNGIKYLLLRKVSPRAPRISLSLANVAGSNE